MDFIKATGLAWVMPITRGGMHSRNAGFAISLTGFGLKTDGVIRCEMLRTVDLQASGAIYVETAPDILVDQALGTANSVLS